MLGQLKKIKLLRGITPPGEPITHVGLTTNAVSPSINIEKLKKTKNKTLSSYVLGLPW